MIKNISTRAKLLLFPFAFIVVVIVSAIVYTHFSNLQNSRSEIATQTEGFVEELLKGRISVYQFLRSPSDETANKVRDNFSKLDKSVIELKSKLKVDRNRQLADEILFSSKEYVANFDKFATKWIIDYKEGKSESIEIKNTIKQMAQSGEILESKIMEIHESAVVLQKEAQESLKNTLIILVIFSIIFFIVVSLIYIKSSCSVIK